MKTLLLFTLLAASAIIRCIGFASHIKIDSRKRLHRMDTSQLGGYANVNDYFASFNTNNEEDDDANNMKRGGNSNGSESPNNNGNRGGTKYIGHGRVRGNAEEGGVFDINNYFNSFGDEEDGIAGDEASYGASQSYNEQPQDAADYTQSTNEQQPQPRRMTYEEIIAYNNARLCPKLLLTQRAIQSFIYLLEECRDPHSGKWIEDYLGLQNLGNYHGTGALNITQYPTWDSVLYSLMSAPNEKMIVSAKRRGRGHGGWSKNNPYLQDRYVEFKIDIRPATLVQRLLPVRVQLASEFEKDLNIVGIVDGMIMESYFSRLRGVDGMTSEQSSEVTAFERVSNDILTNYTEFQEGGSSPFRRGNFDLLYSLSTQTAAHRLLRELQSTTTADDITYQWFKRFYIEKLPQYFDGDQKFGRADDFIDELLKAPPTLVEKSDGRTVGLTDPLQIAERLIALRSEIAQEWRSMMREVPTDHLEMNDVLFRVMMGRTIDESGNDVVEIQEETTIENLADDTGSFE